MCYQLTFQPRDVLFFRDARPVGGSSVGSGANWPLPTVFHAALMSAFYAKWPEPQSWEGIHQHKRSRDKNFTASAMRFGGLRVNGPFPADGNTVYFPTPMDLVPGGMMQPAKLRGSSNLPSPLTMSVVNPVGPSKDQIGSWISDTQLLAYLKGCTHPVTCNSGELFDTEPRPGVGIDPKTHTHRDGIFYQAEYLRLKPGIGMMAFAQAEAKAYGQAQGTDVLQEFFAHGKATCILGGQRGLAYLETVRRKPMFEDCDIQITGNRVKWILLSPALFRNGWLPGWVNAETGRVCLKAGDTARQDGEPRSDWRNRIQALPDINATLLAARTGKPVVYSGWKLDKDADNAGGAPKATSLLVPAGAVYYFEATDNQQARQLAASLTAGNKSDELGEKGFGLGVCANW